MKLISTETKGKGRFYGIQNKVLIYSLGSLILIISLVVSSITSIVERNIKQLTIEKYQYLNEKVITKLKSAFELSDELFKKYIDHSAIQATLQNGEVSTRHKQEVQRMLAYINFEDMARATYIDNKGNVYGSRLIFFNYKQFLRSKLYKVLDGTYSKTKWSWQKDSVFGTDDDALFIIRYIRHMEYPVEPGVFILKMSNQYLENLISDLDNEVNYLFFDSNYNLCYKQDAKGIQLDGETYNKILDEIRRMDNSKTIQLKQGVLFVNQESSSQIYTAVLVPQDKIDAVFKEIRYTIVGIWCFFCVLAAVAARFFTRGFITAIKNINRAMKRFDGTNYASDITVNTNTELDEIAASYDQMLQKIHHLMKEVKLREKALRMSELNSLMYQINPHFLYNTLDNIYMMARLNHDEQMKKMIEALSKFLRIGLSNGQQEITVEEELQHIKSYLEIMKMRGTEELSYSITCEEEIKEMKIIKLILQPIVENSIKYGFNESTKEISIHIDAKKEGNQIGFLVKDSGVDMKQEIIDVLNRLREKTDDDQTVIQESQKGGYGTRNVVNRLKLRYGTNFLFQYESSPSKGTVCCIKVPI